MRITAPRWLMVAGCAGLIASLNAWPASAQDLPPQPAVDTPPVEFDDQSLLDDTVGRVEVFEEFLTAQVQRAINDARGIMATSPDAAIDLLKQAQQAVRNAADIGGNVRLRLNQQLEDGLRAASRAAGLFDEQRAAEQARLQEAAEQQRLVRDLISEQERLDAIMQRFEALMAEQNYAQAEELIRLAHQEAPGVPTFAGGVEATHMRTQFATLSAIRELREQGFVTTLLQNERSSIPFPDDPPIVYPDPDVWERLTESRRRFASVDFADEGEAERRIRAALDQPIRLDFQEAPLEDIRTYLQDQTGIAIVFDNEAMDAEGITPDTPVSVVLENISLRSALRIMLKQLGLTYVIQNEVLTITTITEAETIMIPKVYPVADLVIPIESSGGQGLGLTGAMMGGGNSGFGGGAAGFAGGGANGFGGGMGGGGGGMGMGGGGGGFFNVPPAE